MKPCNCFFFSLTSRLSSGLLMCACDHVYMNVKKRREKERKTGVKMGFGQWEEASFCFYEPNKIWWICTLTVCVSQLLVFIPIAPSLTPVGFLFFALFFVCFVSFFWHEPCVVVVLDLKAQCVTFMGICVHEEKNKKNTLVKQNHSSKKLTKTVTKSIMNIRHFLDKK